MKLRNKKTGEVWNVWSFYDGNQTINLKYFNNDGQVNLEYSSLAELNEEWEDYKPAEPLIKYEKYRKVIKDWAVVNGTGRVRYKEDKDLLEDALCDEAVISFDNFKALDNLENDKIYTITELCGEEECEN